MQQAYARLNQLCEHELKGILHDAEFIRGLVFAVSAAPEIPMPDTWLPWTLKQHGRLSGPEQADLIGEVLMGVMQQQLKEMRDETLGWPDHFVYPDPQDPDSRQSPVCLWLNGLLTGHQYLEPVWQGAWLKMAEKAPDTVSRKQRDLTHCLKMFTTFADTKSAVEEANRVNNQALVERLADIFPSLPDAMAKYLALSGDLVGYLPDQFETFVSDPLPKS